MTRFEKMKTMTIEEAGFEGWADMVFDGIQTTDDLIQLGFTAKKCGRDVPFMEA